jgi:phage head maturation protease
LPGAVPDGQKVRISSWGHRWHDRPVGKGVSHSDQEKAWVDGQFYLDTAAGKDTYQTVKNLADLQEWSYGFDVNNSEPGKFAGQDVRLLRSLTVHEVSPVMLGAGIGTQTTAIKSHPKPEQSEDEAGNAGKSSASILTEINIAEIEMIVRNTRE